MATTESLASATDIRSILEQAYRQADDDTRAKIRDDVSMYSPSHKHQAWYRFVCIVTETHHGLPVRVTSDFLNSLHPDNR